MQPVCIPHTQLPGTSALFRDYLYDFERVERFYRYSPLDAAAPAMAAQAVELPDARRLATAAALRKLNGESAALSQLEVPGTVAVVTGQQVGLFSGPAYTIYKALTAARLARQLSEGGQPAVAVFWLATEDHDFDEIDHVSLFGPDYQPVTLRASGRAADRQPVGTVPIQSAPVEELKRTLAPFAYGDEMIAHVEACYQPGRTFGEAFRELLARLLAGFGLVMIDPMQPELRRIAAPFLEDAAAKSAQLGAAVRRRSAELVAAGYHAQVLFEEGSSLFFHLDSGRRVALKGAPPGDQLSPNALLRPVLQDWLLPTVAYVGGPAELAYLAQSGPLYDALLGRQPVAVSRSGFTLLDERSRSLLEKFDLRLADLFPGEEHVRTHIAALLVPPALDGAFEAARSEVAASAGALERALLGFDPTLSAAMAKSKAKMLYQVEKIRAKAAREALRRDERIRQSAARLSALLMPERHLQERFYTILPFLAQHGPALLDTLYGNVHRECPDHLMLTL